MTSGLLGKKHRLRLALCSHKAVEAGAVCGVLMVQGHLASITLAHLGIATETGVLAIVPVLWLTFTRHARHFANRWTSSAALAACTFLADAAIHRSHYPGEYTEAALTAVGAFVFSIAVSYTPVGSAIDRLSEAFSHDQHPPQDAAPAG